MAAASPRSFSARGVLADLDGTLLDTEPAYYQAYAETAQRLGKPYSDAFHVEHLLGRPEHIGAAAFVRELGVDMTPEALLALRDEVLLARFPAVTPLAGALRVIAAAKAAGLPTAVATSSMRAYFTLKSSHPDSSALIAHFDHVLCGDDAAMAGKRGKPAPDIFHTAAAAIGVPIEQCVVLEDSIAGVQAGKASGAFVVAIPDPRIPREEIVAAGADIIVSSLAELDLAALGLALALGV